MNRRNQQREAVELNCRLTGPGKNSKKIQGRTVNISRHGLLTVIVEPTTPVSVRYRLTARGRDLVASLQPLVAYGQRWESPPPGTLRPSGHAVDEAPSQGGRHV